VTTIDPLQRRSERLRELTCTSADSAMGNLLRRFWHPVGLSRRLAPGQARPLRIMNEDLTLYRGTSGMPHLVAARCAHRLTLLHTGWVESDDIRCMYHGWKYSPDGRCTERPAELDSAPSNVRIAAYPCREYHGLIFAFFGESDPPPFDLPRKHVFEEPGRILQTHAETWPCNWLQMVENSMDAAHVSFVHQAGRTGSFGRAVTSSPPELEYVETDAGIRQIATRGPGNVRISDWTFPNNNHIVVPGLQLEHRWIDVGHWNVPIDDHRTMRFNIWSTPSQGEEIDDEVQSYFTVSGDYDPADHHDELMAGIYPEDQLFDLTSAQDYVAQVGQGVIAEREREILGRSDAGIALLRRIYRREIESLSSGQPAKTWKALEQPVALPIQAG
jgi:5,5'-dehydrodivanillate O-demethylase